MRNGFRGFVMLGLSLLSAVSSARGALLPDVFVPRLSEFRYTSTSDFQTVQLFTTDSDEPLRMASVQGLPPASTVGLFAITTGFQKFHGSASVRVADGTVIPLTGTVITDNAPDVDAFAIGISDGSTLLAFFQMRVAGSSATVSDTSLAAQAVSLGLWTNVNAYFEFPAFHAGIGLVSPGVQPTGPASYVSFIIPEPAGVMLAAVFVAAAGMTRGIRRSWKAKSWEVKESRPL